ncbi:BrnA antitoxin family protein [Methylococcus mesophilus]
MRRGRPPADAPKERITIRLSRHIVDRFKATGPG